MSVTVGACSSIATDIFYCTRCACYVILLSTSTALVKNKQSLLIIVLFILFCFLVLCVTLFLYCVYLCRPLRVMCCQTYHLPTENFPFNATPEFSTIIPYIVLGNCHACSRSDEIWLSLAHKCLQKIITKGARNTVDCKKSGNDVC